MRKMFIVLFSALFIFSFSISALAAGEDDGKIKVTSVGGEKYFGTILNEWAVNYVDASTGEKNFTRYTDVDFNLDNATEICDLVKLSADKVDLNGDGSFTADDSAVMRKLLLGLNDF